MTFFIAKYFIAGFTQQLEFQLSEKDTKHPAFNLQGKYFDLSGRWIGQ